MKIRKKTLKRIGLILLVAIVIFGFWRFGSRSVHSGYACTDCNVVIILIDTLRQDHVGAYGYEKDTTPHIDAFARESLLFKNAVGQSSWTRTSVASIFTSLYPKNHGALNKTTALSSKYTTLAEILKGAGYNTFAFMANPSVSAKEGFDQGFDSFKLFPGAEGFRNYADAEDVNEVVVPFIRKISGGKNFIYIQYMDPHSPYNSREKHFSLENKKEYDDDFFKDYIVDSGKNVINIVDESERNETVIELLRLYDDEILFNDKKIGTVLDTLKENGFYDNSVIIIMSDHGEEFFEHSGNLHSKTLFEEVIQVPLLIHIPGAESKTIYEQVSHIDLMPTLLRILGLKAPANIDGSDIFGSDYAGRKKYAYSELHVGDAQLFSIRSLREKLILGTALLDRLKVRWFEKEAVLDRDVFTSNVTFVDFKKNTELTFSVGDEVADYRFWDKTGNVEIEKDLNPGEDIIIRSSSPCRKVAELGRTSDSRCLSFGVFGYPPAREIYPFYGFYLLEQDGREQNNLYIAPPYQSTVEQMEKSLLRYIKEKRASIPEEQIEYAPEELERLKALGYIK